MTRLRRRDFLRLGANAGIGMSLCARITGLPLSFLFGGQVLAQSSPRRARISILASSSQGEPMNVCGPGTYDETYSSHFTHPVPGAVDASDIVPSNRKRRSIGH